jgi:hypothetical protein
VLFGSLAAHPFRDLPSLDAALSVSNKVKTSQLALPVDACNAVFATDGYSQGVANLKQISSSSDMFFSDGVTLQLPTLTGSISDGYVVTLTVGITV